jgi:hypothetical protein
MTACGNIAAGLPTTHHVTHLRQGQCARDISAFGGWRAFTGQAKVRA